MPGLMHNLIQRAIPDPINLTVRLIWEDRSETQADFAPLAGRGVFAPLAAPVFFESARVIDEGHVLAWPGDLEFDADALWFEVRPEDCPTEAMVGPGASQT